MTNKWITVKPNGQNNTGRPALIGEGGVIKGGMGGKFNGEKISEVRKDFTGAKTPKPANNSKEKAEARIKEIDNALNSENKPKLLERAKLRKEKEELMKELGIENTSNKQSTENKPKVSKEDQLKEKADKDAQYVISLYDKHYKDEPISAIEKDIEKAEKKIQKQIALSEGEMSYSGNRSTRKAVASQAVITFSNSKRDLETYLKYRKSKLSEDNISHATDMAMDFQSLTTVRHIDNNGHLIVDRTCITKAAINPYRGQEIPNWQALGLDPNKVYMLLRCPTELQRALPTFQGLQLLERHTPVSSEEPEKDSTVGSIGTVVEMDGDNVYSSLRVYDQNAIDLIESEKLNQLSAGYAYTADMTGGEWNGEHYDGVMRNIHGNHVALVERGRIGKDAIIADEMPNEIEEFLMSKKIALKKGSLSKLQEQLGMDSAEELKKTIIAVVGQLAHDEDKEEKEAEDEDDEKKSDAEDEEVIEVAEDEDDDKKSDAEDEDDKDDKKQAMDAAMIESNAVAKMKGIFSALKDVEPLVGELAMDGFDSEHDVYAYAVKQKGESVQGVNTAGLKLAVKHLKAGSQSKQIAQDSAYASASTGLKSITGHIRKG